MTDMEVMIAVILATALTNSFLMVLIYCDLGDIKRAIKEVKNNE